MSKQLGLNKIFKPKYYKKFQGTMTFLIEIKR